MRTIEVASIPLATALVRCFPLVEKVGAVVETEVRISLQGCDREANPSYLIQHRPLPPVSSKKLMGNNGIHSQTLNVHLRLDIDVCRVEGRTLLGQIRQNVLRIFCRQEEGPIVGIVGVEARLSIHFRNMMLCLHPPHP